MKDLNNMELYKYLKLNNDDKYINVISFYTLLSILEEHIELVFSDKIEEL